MAAHLVVQASGAMFSTSSPEAWTYMLVVFVTDQDGTPVQGLKKKNFSVWDLAPIHSRDIRLITELYALLPSSKMPGVYQVQATANLGITAPHPQQFVLAVRVSQKKGKTELQGMTTVPITYLGQMH